MACVYGVGREVKALAVRAINSATWHGHPYLHAGTCARGMPLCVGCLCKHVCVRICERGLVRMFQQVRTRARAHARTRACVYEGVSVYERHRELLATQIVVSVLLPER